MKKCPYCSAEIEDSARFCLYCMTSLDTKKVINTSHISSKRWHISIAAFLVFATFAVLLSSMDEKIPSSLLISVTSQGETSLYTQGEAPISSSLSHSSDVAQNTDGYNSNTPSHNVSIERPSSTTSADGVSNSLQSDDNPDHTSTTSTSSKGSVSTSTSSSISTSSKPSSSTPNKTPSSSSNNVTSSSQTATNSSNISTEGIYKYAISNSKATITDVDYSVSGNIVVPSKLGGYPVTTIAKSAFSGCDLLKSVTIPVGVKTIESGAFDSCTMLKSVSLPAGLTTIEKSAFKNCAALTDINLPGTLTKINSGTFLNCSALKNITIPNGVLSIEDNAFLGCSSLEKIIIPDSVTAIGDEAFSNCSGLRSVSIGGGLKIVPDSFTRCLNVETIIIKEGVTKIGADAFMYCEKLRELYIPKTLIEIESRAFHYSTELENIYYAESSLDKKTITIGAFNDPLSLATWHFNSEY